MSRKRTFIWPKCALLSASALLFSCNSAPPSKKASAPEQPKILNFYASPGTIAKGEDALLCYGTEGVAEVKIDPPVESLKPALSRCFQVKPDKTTAYKLTATGTGGSVEQTTEVRVEGVKKPEPAASIGLIRLFVADRNEAKAGDRVTLCYATVKATAVRLNPGGKVLPPSDRNCTMLPITQTTTYVLEATGAGGVKERDSLTVTVR